MANFNLNRAIKCGSAQLVAIDIFLIGHRNKT